MVGSDERTRLYHQQESSALENEQEHLLQAMTHRCGGNNKRL